MWLGKSLDLEKDMEEIRSKIKREIFNNVKKRRLTPLEFTIIEHIFNNQIISGYDLIRVLNEHFAGTWEAQSGTIYPLLSKLKRDGFLKVKTVKTQVGPLRKVYSLSEAGEEILKVKVNKNFFDQLKFVRNVLVELSSIYINSFPEELKEVKIKEVQKLIKEITEYVIETIPSTVEFKIKCSNCGSEVGREGARFCPYCSASLFKEDNNKEGETKKK